MIEEHNKDGEAWPDTFIETVEDHTKDGEALPDHFGQEMEIFGRI